MRTIIINRIRNNSVSCIAFTPFSDELRLSARVSTKPPAANGGRQKNLPCAVYHFLDVNTMPNVEIAPFI